MTKLLQLLLVVILSSFGLNAQVVVNSDITTNTTWTANNIYLLQGGCLYVRNNATLTIEPGTLIKGDAAALIVLRGSSIVADGTVERPIVFTSSKPPGQRNPGDWGGIILLGKAPINVPGGEATVEGGCGEALYGGNDAGDNSGILRYVRIEFAGIPFQPNNELNSLTLGGVGAGTTIEHVQTSYGGDDAFEWFGGRVNGKWLVAYRTVDDMFDTDFGYSGRNQWVLGISDPAIADVSGSNGFESDNDGQGTTNNPKTNAHFSNVTILGPTQPGGLSINPLYRRALHIRRCSYLDVYNSVFTGFPVGYKIESTCTIDGFTTTGDVEFKNNVLAAMTTIIEPNDAAVLTQFNNSGNSTLTTVQDLELTNPFDFSSNNPDFRPSSTSLLLSGADFGNSTLQDAFFTPTSYRGAFGNNDWTDCWTEWNPVYADYETGSINYGLNPGITFTKIGSEVNFAGATQGAVTYSWDFGDGNSSEEQSPTHTYASTGPYDVTLTVVSERGCTNSATITVSDVVAIKETDDLDGLKVYPNPFSSITSVEFALKNQMTLDIRLTDLTGRVLSLSNQEFHAGLNRFEIDGSGLSTGVYFLCFISPEGYKTICLSVVK